MNTEEFLDELFREQSGVIYAPTMKTRWTQNFFRWPEQKPELLSHFLTQSEQGQDAYLSPALFTERRVSPTTFKGTYHVWAEFDGNAPATVELEPSLRIQSSLEGYEHWYWGLDHFETDPKILEQITKRLTYHFGADLSGWDYQTVLRPPGTKNFARKKKKRQTTVLTLETSLRSYTLQDFADIPDPPLGTVSTIDKKNLTPLPKLVATYSWTEDAYELLTKKVEHPHRSDALSRLAFECVEMGMSNEEVFVVLVDADRRWEKFTTRTDRERRLLGIINYVRSKKAYTGEILDRSPVYRFRDFMETDINLEWVVEGILPVAGSAVIFGPPGLGKTTLMLNLAIAIALGKEEFLGWKIKRRQKVMFFSLEMFHDELKEFFKDMKLTEEEVNELQEWLFIWPIGHAYPMDVKDQQIEILKYLDQFEAKLLIIDSLGNSTYGNISSQDDNKRLYSFLNEDVRAARGCGYWFIHHPRKMGNADEKKPLTLDDGFGDSYIMNNAQTTVSLSGRGDELKLDFLKSRLSRNNSNIRVRRNDNRTFSLSKTPVEKKLERMLEEAPGILNLGG